MFNRIHLVAWRLCRIKSLFLLVCPDASRPTRVPRVYTLRRRTTETVRARTSPQTHNQRRCEVRNAENRAALLRSTLDSEAAAYRTQPAQAGGPCERDELRKCHWSSR